MAHERWQYQVLEMKPQLFSIKTADMQDQLNKAGQQGWELVAVRQVSTTMHLFLKRRL